MKSDKLHYKMYKAGSKWVFASITVVSFGLGSQLFMAKVSADVNTAVSSSEVSSQSSSDDSASTSSTTDADATKSTASS
ncbi:KxYKxGKxW signal peptide domain-containing protein, partial [Liquorilactobacillus cacaonum]|uniref:KxYKxGKxW signal peptide domain-containing protein n=1 Tax=Liquorilactobacillus cacaonum TaxID=483012 RepID=UPI00146FCA19